VALRERELPVGDPAAPPQSGTSAPTPVCWALAGICGVMFAVNIGLGGQPFKQMVLYGPKVLQGEWWRVLTCVFAHGSVLHILFNMSAVWTLGRMLEAGIGTFRFLITTLVGALGSSFAVLVVNFDQPTLGISGVILAWAGAMLPIVNQAGRRSLGTWLIQVVVISLLPGVSWAGHLGGFVFGVPCGFVMRKGPTTFRAMAPVLLFIAGVLVYLAGTGKIGLGPKE
jgi:rhomboid protease GluP